MPNPAFRRSRTSFNPRQSLFGRTLYGRPCGSLMNIVGRGSHQLRQPLHGSADRMIGAARDIPTVIPEGGHFLIRRTAITTMCEIVPSRGGEMITNQRLRRDLFGRVVRGWSGS